MADHVVVMRAGVIEQQGAPLELYDRPANKFVAGFIGSPAMNFVPGIATETGIRLGLPGDPVIACQTRVAPGRRVLAGLRPEHLALDPAGPLRLPVALVEQTGSTSFLVTETEPMLTVSANLRRDLKIGDIAALSIAPERVHLFDPETEVRL